MKRIRQPPSGWQLRRAVECSTIIGLGGIGRQLGLQFAALGIPRLQLIDPRMVARATQAAEGYLYHDVGRPRVHATADLCHQVNPRLDIQSFDQRSLQGIDPGDAVLCCPGSPSIWRALGRRIHDETVVARCDVRDGTIQLGFARGAASLGRLLGRNKPSGASPRAARRSAVPIYVATAAAGLFVVELIQFAVDHRPRRAVRFDLQSLDVNVEE